MFSPNTLINKQENIVIKKINNEFILVPIINNIANMKSIYTMNESGVFLWNKIDGKKNFQQLVFELMEEYDVSNEEALKDTEEFLKKIKPLLI